MVMGEMKPGIGTGMIELSNGQPLLERVLEETILSGFPSEKSGEEE